MIFPEASKYIERAGSLSLSFSFSPFSQYYRDFFTGNGFKSFYSTPSVTRTGTQRNKTPDRQTVSNTNVTYSSILVLQVPAPVCGLAKPELKKLDNDLGNSLRCLPIIICCGYRADKDENIQGNNQQCYIFSVFNQFYVIFNHFFKLPVPSNYYRIVYCLYYSFMVANLKRKNVLIIPENCIIRKKYIYQYHIFFTC